ncbi:signal peptidase I [Rhodococcus sp. BH5]|uniref:signal peptidase I n=1 Tax=Rhodococcus sp. BH5 TaxID=2871702 RepID=UPI0022CD5D46|nr:signal peptidase I [Rhodococcus sp. BH5]MCZ9635234.1 signal peptidase I [Rhodococcus sp. BH5]
MDPHRQCKSIADRNSLEVMKLIAKFATFPVRKVLAVLNIFVISLFVIAGIFLVFVPRVTGGAALRVVSGSMEPTIRAGDIIVVRGIGPDDSDMLSLGSVVTFQPYPNDATLVTHRIVQVNISEDGRINYITKGDANRIEDAAISIKQVRGKYLYRVPFMGYITQWVGANANSISLWLGVVGIAFGLGSVIFSSFGSRRKSVEDN